MIQFWKLRKRMQGQGIRRIQYPVELICGKYTAKPKRCHDYQISLIQSYLQADYFHAACNIYDTTALHVVLIVQ